jgi:hypothetical protein
VRRLVLIALAFAILGVVAVACGGGDQEVERAVREAADARLAAIERPGSPPLRVVSVSCQRTTAIQDDVDQYYCDIRVADEAGAGFVDNDSEVFYSTSTGTAELLEFPPRSATG